MRSQLAALCLFGAFSLSAIASSSVDDMSTRARQSLARDAAYEMTSTREFWGDASFMKDCVPPGSPVQAPFAIYFEVLPNGHLGSLLFAPATPLSACIKRHISGRRFSNPPAGVSYVTKIDLTFDP